MRRAALTRGLAVAACWTAAFASAAPALAQDPQHIITLGDSYASGEGSRNKANPDWDKNAGGRNGCHRGPNAWARLLGTPLGWHLACTGAVIDDVLRRGQKSHKPDNVSQLSRLITIEQAAEIDAVLMMIGGNDVDFAGKIKSCFFGHKCLRDLDKIDRELAELKPRLIDAYDQVANATAGDLIVVSYPDIFPSRAERNQLYKCGWLGENKKRGTAEKTGVWHLQAGLHRTIREAAQEADVDFISVRDALDGREMCTRRSLINKLTPTGKDRAHPNAKAQKLIADTVREGLEDLYSDEATDVAAVAAVKRPW
jgi:lysophospholipase L1-like esterase